MLNDVKQNNVNKELVSEQIEMYRARLSGLENKIKESKLPVIITIDGWSASGKGSQIAQLIKCLDPRFYKVMSFGKPNEVEKRKPWLWRFACAMPMQGNFLILDRSWYRDTANAYLYDEISKSEMRKRLDDINVFERQLADDGYLIVKFFLHITEEEQKKRIKKLTSSDYTSWRIDEHDLYNLKKREKFAKYYEEMITKTNTPSGVWNIIGGDDKTGAKLEMIKALVLAVEGKLEAKASGSTFVPKNQFPFADVKPQEFKMANVQKVSEAALDKTLTDEEYEKQLEKCQDKLFKLQNLCYQKKIPVIICYEGWDAAGKGGNIRRVANALDPRGYEVEPIAAPDKYELARHYLYRFWIRLENDGHFTIFDRTWYGRVMVEPIENITPPDRVEQAYQEINEFEKLLIQWGAVVIKFWINIDKEEQLKRFTLRQNTPEKQWKITDEDWRNREKWDIYEKYIDTMIEKTSTKAAPWTIIEGNDKKYARIKAMKTIIEKIEEKLEKNK
ncbi:polyphosphate:AMP phosphotransferase [Ruminococcus sp. FC2018]|uniref:polyphosphate:AMP phosphotransferase n=1 Tax=Ruminococcus sp. FC2018 TaxID=1410617 RepID=UPI0004920654|nr:polyphosphate:AMP phosphotransferase [Ruminococcus sp. FC2018]